MNNDACHRCRNGDACEDGPWWTKDAFTYDGAHDVGDRVCNACYVEMYGRAERKRCDGCGKRFRTRRGKLCPSCRTAERKAA